MTADPSRRIVLVTGASRGLGLATAHALIDRGITPVLGIRRSNDGHAPSAGSRGAGIDPMSVDCDVTDPGQVAAAIDAIIDRHGALHGVVNNAAQIDPIALVGEADPRDWHDTLASTLEGAYTVIHAALPHLLASGAGTIVNVSSGAALRPFRGWSAYCCAKAGLAMLTVCVHLEHGASGLATYGFQPGVLDTDMQARIRDRGLGPTADMPRSALPPPSHAARALARLIDLRPEAGRGLEVGFDTASAS
jgi:NAD(P)-dependent dehydrogenase (short-subunit alcohol dehydrogenase family)